MMTISPRMNISKTEHFVFKYVHNQLPISPYLVQTPGEEIFPAAVGDVHWHVVVLQVA